MSFRSSCVNVSNYEATSTDRSWTKTCDLKPGRKRLTLRCCNICPNQRKRCYMTVMELGAIGEFAGALLLFASLVFVGLQIRQNNIGMKVAAKQEMTRQYSDYMDTLIKDPEVSNIYVRGAAGEKLTEAEAHRFNNMMAKAAWYYASMHYQREIQGLSDKEWHQPKQLISRSVRNKGFRQWWQRRGAEFSPAFIAFVEEQLHEDVPTGEIALPPNQ